MHAPRWYHTCIVGCTSRSGCRQPSKPRRRRTFEQQLSALGPLTEALVGSNSLLAGQEKD
jgi:hypothetical protein